MRLDHVAATFVAVVMSVLTAAPVVAVNVSWNNAAGGNWNIPANWNPSKVPEAADDVFITFAGTYTVTLNVDATLASLTIGGGAGVQTLANTSRSLTLQGASAIAATGVYQQSGGLLTGSGNLTVNGTFDWMAGSTGGTGTTNVGATGLLILGTAGTKNLQRSINNGGTTRWTDTGVINSGAGAVFTNQVGATFDIRNDTTFSYSLAAPASRFVNAGGTVIKSMSGGTTAFNNMQFVQQGIVNVNTGVLAFAGGGSSSSPFNIASGARLDFTGSVYNLEAGSGFVGMGPARLNGATLTANANTSAENFELLSGTLNGGATFSVTDSLDWMAGNMGGSGATNIAATAELTIRSAGTKNLQRSINNAGTTRWTDTGLINSGAGAVFTNQVGALFDIRNDSTFSYSLAAPPSRFVNAGGTVIKSMSGGTTAFNNMQFVQQGIVNIDTGVLTFTGGGSSSSPFNIAGGARLDFTSSVYNLEAGSGFVGMGPARLNGATLTANANTSAENFELFGGTLNGGANFTVTDSLDWMAGAMSGSGATNIAATAELTIRSAGTKNLQRSINNAGTTRWMDTGVINSGAGAVFTNQVGALFDIRNDTAFSYNLAAPPSGFVNAGGMVIKSMSAGTTAFNNLPVLNQGAFNISSGVVSFTGTYTQTAGATHLSGGNLSASVAIALQGGVFDGTGTVTGSISNSGGQMNPGTSPGRVTMTVDFLQLGGGTYNVDIDGVVAGTGYDQLAVTRTVTVAGALDVSAGFAPAPGTVFTIIDNAAADAVAGTFAGLPEGATVNADGVMFTISYVGDTGNDVILTAGGGGAPSRTPTSTATRTWTHSPTQSPTPASATPTNIVAATATHSATSTSTRTPSVTPSHTPSRTPTLQSTGTPPATSTVTPTRSLTPTATSTSSPTLTTTSTPTGGQAPTPTSSPADVVPLRGRCIRPGPGGEPGDHGQVGFTDGIIRLFFCERSRRGSCIGDPGQPIATTTPGPRGFFRINVPREFLVRRLFVVEVTFGDVTTYKLRTLKIVRNGGFGRGSGAGEEEEDVLVDSISEAAVQLIDQQGLENFDEEGVDAVIDAVEMANADANFETLDPDEAANAALMTAMEDPEVQMVLQESRAVLCGGDCDVIGSVTVDEIVRCVSVALGQQPSSSCASCDLDFSTTVTVDEIITSVNNALNGCPA